MHVRAFDAVAGQFGGRMSPTDRDAAVTGIIERLLARHGGEFNPEKIAHRLFSGGDASEQRANSQLNGLLNRGQLEAFIDANAAFQWSPRGSKGMVIREASSPGTASAPATAPAAAAKAAAAAPGSASAPAHAPAAAGKAAAAPGSASASDPAPAAVAKAAAAAAPGSAVERGYGWPTAQPVRECGWLRWEWIEWITGLPAEGFGRYTQAEWQDWFELEDAARRGGPAPQGHARLRDRP